MNTEFKKGRKRSVISLRIKLRILDRINKGEKPAYVATSLGLNESTVRSIYLNEKKIRTSVGLGYLAFAYPTGRCRPKILEKMEIELNAWINSRLEISDPPDTTSIKQKALSIYNTLKEQGETPTNPHFAASSGWFERFRKRFLIRSTNIKDEIMPDSKNDSDTEEICTDQNSMSPKMKEEIISGAENDSYTEEILENPDYNNVLEQEKEHEKRKKNNGVIADIQQFSDIPHSPQMKRFPEQILPDVQMMPVNTFGTNKIDKELGSFTLKSLRTGLDLAKQLELYFLNEDPCIERRTKFKAQLHCCLAPYTKIYSNLTQVKITDFFSKCLK